MQKKRITTKRIVIDALFAAMFILLSYLSVTIANAIKISFESLPVLIGALMFGPVDGILIGGVGAFAYQMLGPYGITPTIPLWILPYVVMGALVGAYAKKSKLRNTKKQILCIAITAELVAFIFNTIAILVDSKLYGYYSVPLVWGGAAIRVAIALAKALIERLIVPPILDGMAIVTGRKRAR